MQNRTRFRRGMATLALFSILLAGAGVAVSAAPDRATKSETKAVPSAPIDLNSASATELTALPGVGSSIAQRIVAFREEHGPFRRVEEVMKVKGIGEKSFLKLKPYLKVTTRS